MLGLNDEILTYLLLIFVGYIIAKMFSRCEGFSVGADIVGADIVGADIVVCPSQKVDGCLAHDTNCNSKYTENTLDSGFHKCKKGGFINGYQCISTDTECRFEGGHSCKFNSYCLNSSCVNSMCAQSAPSPPPPSCPSGQTYCMNEKICVDKCQSGEELSSQCICLPICCSHQTCTDPNVCKP